MIYLLSELLVLTSLVISLLPLGNDGMKNVVDWFFSFYAINIFLCQIEAIMNDFIQLKPQSNVYEAETMVEG